MDWRRHTSVHSVQSVCTGWRKAMGVPGKYQNHSQPRFENYSGHVKSYLCHFTAARARFNDPAAEFQSFLRKQETCERGCFHPEFY